MAKIPSGIVLAGNYNLKVITGQGASNLLPFEIEKAAPKIIAVSYNWLSLMSISGVGFFGGTGSSDVLSMSLGKMVNGQYQLFPLITITGVYDPEGPTEQIFTNITNTCISGVDLPQNLEAGDYDVVI